MTGQGCPNYRIPLGVTCAAIAAWVGSVLVLTTCLTAQSVDQNDPTVRVPQVPLIAVDAAHPLDRPAMTDPAAASIRVRLTWGGGTPLTWAGELQAKHGRLSQLVPLSLEVDSSAATILHGDEQLRIRHWAATSYGGADVRLEMDDSTQLQISLAPEEHPEDIFLQTIDARELLQRSVVHLMDERGNRFSIQRLDYDQVEVKVDRSHLVFRPGEQFSFQWRPQLTAIKTRNATGSIDVIATATNRRVDSQTTSFKMEDTGSAELQQVDLAMPMVEGVYQIELKVDSVWYQPSFGSRQPAIKRTLEVVVLDESSRAPNGPSAWVVRHVIPPVENDDSKFKIWPRRFNRHPSLANDLRRFGAWQGQPTVSLLPGGWQAKRLALDQIGKPHLIEIDYVCQQSVSMGVSLLEIDSQGQVANHGFDSGIHVPESSATNSGIGQWQTHRMLVWPSTANPYLLLANRHATGSIEIGEIRILQGPDRLEPMHNEAAVAAHGPPTRKLMKLIENPVMLRSLGGPGKYDAASGDQLDDWESIYVSADRLIQYLKFNGYRGAYLSVVGDGSSVYPSQLLAPSPRWDNGVFFADGRGAVRRDILEMLLRMFEREGLLLVPMFNFNGPLAELEAARSAVDQTSAFDLFDVNRIRRDPRQSMNLPLYNPLDRQVQRSVTRVLEEFLTRYGGRFNAINGIAITCRPDTCTLLPGRQWGYDGTTIQQFAQSQSEIDIPEDWSAAQHLLLTQHASLWTAWRAEQMAQWYRELSNTLIRMDRPEAKLYFAPIDLYRNQELAGALSPSLHRAVDFKQWMMRMGIPAGEPIADATTVPAMVWLAPHRIALDQSLVSRRVDLAVDNSQQAQEFYSASGYRGDLFQHHSSWAQFSQLQQYAPFDRQLAPLVRLQPLRSINQFNRQRFVEAIKLGDSRQWVDGGIKLDVAHDPELADLLQVFGQLPDQRFQDVGMASYADLPALPVAVRQLATSHGTYFYIANASPWPVSVRLTSATEPTMPKTFSFLPLPGTSWLQPGTDSGPRFTTNSAADQKAIQLAPYSLVGGLSDVRGARILGFEFQLPAYADKELRKRVYSLQAKLVQAQKAVPILALENPQFSVEPHSPLPGWAIGQQDPDSFQIKTEFEADRDGQERSPVAGQRFLQIINQSNSPAWIRSNSFELPATGRLSVSAWLKTTAGDDQPAVRMAIEGKTANGNYYRFGSLGRLAPEASSNQLGDQWKRFAVHFDDLPASGLTDIRIGFDLMDVGQVSIANIEVFDRWYDDNDAKAVTQLLASTDAMLLKPESFDRCRRLLNEYWAVFLQEFIPLPDQALPDTLPLSLQRDGEGSDERGAEPGDRAAENKVPMFRRFRDMVPARNSSYR